MLFPGLFSIFDLKYEGSSDEKEEGKLILLEAPLTGMYKSMGDLASAIK